MGFDVGNNKGDVRPTINVTPLVDVVLVLLIIFMVITPLLTKQFWLHVPIKDDKKEQEPPPDDDGPPPIVLSIAADGGLFINKDSVGQEELQERLRRVLAGQRETTLFFAADDEVPYGRAMDILDIARGGGALTIAVLTEKIPQ